MSDLNSDLKKEYDLLKYGSAKTELIKDSGVFVMKSDLRLVCVSAGHDMNRMARALLTIVFKPEELKTSVLMGKGSSRDEYGNVRQPLDPKKREALMGRQQLAIHCTFELCQINSFVFFQLLFFTISNMTSTTRMLKGERLQKISCTSFGDQYQTNFVSSERSLQPSQVMAREK